MSESENVPEKKKISSSVHIMAFMFFLAILVAIAVYSGVSPIEEGISTEEVSSGKQDQGKENSEDVASKETDNVVGVSGLTIQTEESVLAPPVELDLERLSTPRILGNPDAPVKISEHSSFTCGACARFHKENFKKIKADYIDTGKAYVVYDDFPRNVYDLNIGAVARCVPESSYFKFVQLLFETQKDWFSEEYLGYVKQNALLTGTSPEKIEACLDNDSLRETLAERAKKAMEEHGVNATPTLVINDEIVLRGLAPYEEIVKALDEAHAKSLN